DQGDFGLAVFILQRLLVIYNYLSSDTITGVFSAETDQAVRQFQHDNGLYTDGIVGLHTWTALSESN
ncbi:MAG TPA: peptidoglycan-binding domain-containing protein, partial [Crinalium sp.]